MSYTISFSPQHITSIEFGSGSHALSTAVDHGRDHGGWIWRGDQVVWFPAHITPSTIFRHPLCQGDVALGPWTVHATHLELERSGADPRVIDLGDGRKHLALELKSARMPDDPYHHRIRAAACALVGKGLWSLVYHTSYESGATHWRDEERRCLVKVSPTGDVQSA